MTKSFVTSRRLSRLSAPMILGAGAIMGAACSSSVGEDRSSTDAGPPPTIVDDASSSLATPKDSGGGLDASKKPGPIADGGPSDGASIDSGTNGSDAGADGAGGVCGAG